MARCRASSAPDAPRTRDVAERAFVRQLAANRPEKGGPEKGRTMKHGPDSLDVQNGAFFCDSSSGALIGDDDAVEHPPAHTAGRNELRHRPRRRDGELLRHDARGEAVRDPEQAP